MENMDMDTGMEMMKCMSFFKCVIAVVVGNIICWGACKLLCKDKC